MQKKVIEIFTDGSCIGNPGPGGWAAVILEKDNKGIQKPITKLKGGQSETTNNRMEMIAVIEALRFIHENNLQIADIILHSDSNLIVKSLNEGWKRKANIDLWEEIDTLNEELSVEYVWVRGHNKNKWNEEVDRLALQEATKAKQSSGKIKGREYGSQKKLF
jgi:ribonuclease HI